MLVRDEGEFAIGDHHSCKVLHDGCSLDMKIPEHFVAAPTANELDFVRVNVGAKESHGSSSS